MAKTAGVRHRHTVTNSIAASEYSSHLGSPGNPEITPKLSTEVFIIPLEEERYIVYAPLRLAAFVANAATVNFLAEIQHGHWESGADPDGSLREFLRRLEILDAPPAQPPSLRRQGSPRPTEVTLFLTTACNLRCTYCYASAGDTRLETMTMEVARRGIDFVAENAAQSGQSHFDVAYHGGGEPTVNWPVLKGSYDYARSKANVLGLK